MLAEWRAVVDTIGDTIRVRTVAGSVWGDTVSLVPEVSIGEMDGADEDVLAQPRGLAPERSGEILILDAQIPILRLYDAAGTFLRNIGRDGSGPGEYASPAGEILDTLPAPTWDFDFPVLTASGENSRSVTPVPFSPTVSWSFSPLGYMVGGLSTDYRIDLFRPDGTVLRIEKEWAPVRVSPEEKPPFKDIIVSREGNIWASRATPGIPFMTDAEAGAEEARTGRMPQRFREPVAFDVFSPEGEFLGPVQVPPTFRTEPKPIIRGNHVWALTRDELDVPWIVRFRIQGSDPQTGSGTIVRSRDKEVREGIRRGLCWASITRLSALRPSM